MEATRIRNAEEPTNGGVPESQSAPAFRSSLGAPEKLETEFDPEENRTELPRFHRVLPNRYNPQLRKSDQGAKSRRVRTPERVPCLNVYTTRGSCIRRWHSESGRVSEFRSD